MHGGVAGGAELDIITDEVEVQVGRGARSGQLGDAELVAQRLHEKRRSALVVGGRKIDGRMADAKDTFRNGLRNVGTIGSQLHAIKAQVIRRMHGRHFCGGGQTS